VATIVRFWPVIGIAGMLLLGVAVGKGGNRLDDWFLYHAWIRVTRPFFLFFIDARVLLVLFLAVLAAALALKRWRLAALTVITPMIGLTIARLCKKMFGRHIGEGLAYPSGHTTVMVIVLGMLVLLTGCRTWVVVAAVICSLFGMLGASMTFHYMTDTLGAAMLGTALVAGAAQLLWYRPRSART